MVKTDETNKTDKTEKKPVKKAKRPTLQVVTLEEAVSLQDAQREKLVKRLENELRRCHAKMEALEAEVRQMTDTPLSIARKRLKSALGLIRYVADMDQACYKKPNDWHLAVQMAQHAQQWLADDAKGEGIATTTKTAR